jgi:hypothetical protein
MDSNPFGNMGMAPNPLMGPRLFGQPAMPDLLGGYILGDWSWRRGNVSAPDIFGKRTFTVNTETGTMSGTITPSENPLNPGPVVNITGRW